MTTLVAVGFPHATTASAAAEDVLRLASDLVVDADAIAVISHDDQGRFHVTTHHHAVPGGASWGIFWLLLFSVVFFVPSFGMAVGTGLGTLLGTVEGAGIDAAFQDQIRHLLRPGTSALFLAADPTIPASTVEALSRFGGTIVTSPLSKESEVELQRALHGLGPGPGAGAPVERRVGRD
jgi:uncharacterized membrane protein